MNIEKLIKMGNEIGAYFASDPDRDHAQHEIAVHLKRFWAPRMRRALLQHVVEQHAIGVSELVAQAVVQHRSTLE